MIRQFYLETIIVVTVSFLAAQIRYMKNQSPGYQPEGIMLVYNLNQKLISSYTALKERLLSLPGIGDVAASWHTIGGGTSGQGILMVGVAPDDLRSIAEYRIRPGLCALYRFNLISGRFLEPDRVSDNRGVILNEKALEMQGRTPQDIVGEQVVMHDEPLDVVGVVKDFRFESAAVEVRPLVLTAYSDAIRTLSIRVDPGTDLQTLPGAIRDIFREFDPDYVMISRFATDIIEGYYTAEERLQKILLFGSLFSLVIVMLGIYALVSHNLVRRTKEIGIRKVMGGSTGEMITLIYKSTLKWSLLASILAIPLSWLYLDRWLNDFVLRIPL